MVYSPCAAFSCSYRLIGFYLPIYLCLYAHISIVACGAKLTCQLYLYGHKRIRWSGGLTALRAVLDALVRGTSPPHSRAMRLRVNGPPKLLPCSALEGEFVV